MTRASIGRRETIALLGGVALVVATARSSAAQEPGRVYRLAYLTGLPRGSALHTIMFEMLRQAGFIESQNLSLLEAGFNRRDDEFPAVAAEIVRANPDAIFSAGPVAIRAAQAATSSVAILGMSEDMVTEGLVASLARPGGNTTGISLLAHELDGKRAGLLMEAVPGIRRLGTLCDPKVHPQKHLDNLATALQARGVEFVPFAVPTRDDIVPVMNTAKAAGIDGLNVLATPLFFFNRRVVIEHAATLRLPAIYQWPEMAEEGGMLGYGPRLIELYRQLARQLAKVLRGAKPAELPVEQPTTFELVVNLQTAKQIGHDIPAGLVLRADKVIE